MSIPTLTIGSSFNQARAALGYMGRMAHAHKAEPELVTLAQAIVAGIPDDEPARIAEAVQDWVRSTVTYRRAPEGTQYIQDVPVTLAVWTGDCASMAVLCTALLLALGHSAAPLGVFFSGDLTPSHAVTFDATAETIVDPVSGVSCAAWPPEPYVLAAFVSAA